MAKANPLHHFFDAVDRAHRHQKQVTMAFSVSIDEGDQQDSLTVEFELLPPKDKPTDKTKRSTKK